MKKVFFVNGGAGRVLCSIPAFLKYYKSHGDDFYIISESGIEFFVGIPELTDVVYDLSHKGVFESIIKPNQCVTLEPYREYGYYNQQKSLIESFDKLVNETDDHSDLPRTVINLNQKEEINAVDIINKSKEYHGKKKVVVLQPFGRTSELHEKSGQVIDVSSRSLTTDDYYYISEKIRKKYNVITMSEIKFKNDKNLHIETNLRQWAAVIEAADYFVGVDSVGQHMAYAFDKPGSVIIGSTFAENISYPNHFNIVEKKDQQKKYSPIRIEGIDSDLANRHNDKCMSFSKREIEEITTKILRHIKSKIGE